jgi:hypothetical protein
MYMATPQPTDPSNLSDMSDCTCDITADSL